MLRASHNPCQRREMTVSSNNGLVNGPVHNLHVQFFTLGSSKIEVFETCFYDIVTTQNDHPRYVKHVLGRIYVFFTLFGYSVKGGGSPKGLVHNVLTQLFTLGSSKIEVFETSFHDIVATENDHASYVKHVLSRIYLFFTLFGYWVQGGGSPKGLVHNLLLQLFTPAFFL